MIFLYFVTATRYETKSNTMSNYENPPSVNDTCMVCMEVYKTQKKIHVPSTCVHHLCTKCVKRCKECPYCKIEYPKVVKEKPPTQCMIKHIYFLRKNMYQYVKMVYDTRDKFGDFYSIHYASMLDNMITHIILMEKELQVRMTIVERNRRKNTLPNHPYNCDRLVNNLILHQLI